MNKPVKNGEWNKLRFEWKRLVNRSQHLSRGSKHLASCICDDYVSRKNGQCFPSNRTLAEALNVTERSVQRYLEELEHGGWIRRLKNRGRRRVIHLVMLPSLVGGIEHDNKHDSGLSGNTTALSRKGDTDVVPYKNQGSNQTMKAEKQRNLSYLEVAFSEENIISQWVVWIKENTDGDVDRLLDKLRTRKGFKFPRRYPADGPAEREKYLRFFAVMSGEQWR